MGRSRGGFSTKIHAVVDFKGRPLHVALTPGQQHESTVAEALLMFARGRAFIADTAYDADRIIAAIHEQGMQAVICNSPSRRNNRRRMNRKLYRERYLVEVFFHQLKRFRALATRFEKTARNYLGLIQLACAWLWLK